MHTDTTLLQQQILAWLLGRSWIDCAELFFVVMSIVGQHFISERKLKGFYFWLAGNVVAVVVWTIVGRFPTAILYCYFTYKCITGARTWRQLDQEATLARPLSAVLQGSTRA